MKKWYCIYTKPSQEDNLLKRFSEFPDIELFIPKFNRKRRIRSRLVEMSEVLFPCYIFSCLEIDQYFHMIRYTRGVRRFVGDRDGSPYVVNNGIIDYLKSRMQNGLVRFEPPRLARGERVEFVEGPFCGMRGEVLETLRPNERVIVLLSTIAYQARVEADTECLTRVPAAEELTSQRRLSFQPA